VTRREVDHAWTEERELPGKVTLEFEGVNTSAFEAMEIQNFQRGLSEPQEDDPGSGGQNVESGGGRGSPAQLLVSFVLGLVLAAIGYGVSSSFEIFKGRENAIAFGSFFVGVFTPMVVGAALTGRARDKGDVVPKRITVEMTSDALTAQGTTRPMSCSSIARVAPTSRAPPTRRPTRPTWSTRRRSSPRGPSPSQRGKR